MDKQTNVGEYTGHGLEFSEASYWLTEDTSPLLGLSTSASHEVTPSYPTKYLDQRETLH